MYDVQRPVSPTRLEAFRLENGLQVIAIPFPDSETVTIMVWYKAGSADDPPDKPGLAHFVEHATFAALGDHNEDERRTTGDARDHEPGEPEAFTSFDYTAYYRIVPPEDVEQAMEVEAARLSSLAIDRRAVEAERDAVIEEWVHDIEENPEALLEERVRALLWATTPYGHPVVSDLEKTRSISVQDIRNFYSTWYAPNNALLIVSGRLDPRDLVERAEKHFGKIPMGEVPQRNRPRAVPPEVDDRIVLLDPNAHETYWARAYVAPSFAKGGDGAVAATAVLRELLAAEPAAFLHRDLIDLWYLAGHIGVDYPGDALGHDTFLIHAILRPRIDVMQFERALGRALATLASEAVTGADVARARDRIRRAIAETWNDPFEAANAVGAALATGRSLHEMMTWEDSVAAVTPGQVRDAAQNIFASGINVSGVLRPK